MFFGVIAAANWLEDLMELIRLRELIASIRLSIVLFFLIAALVILVELRSGAPVSKYKSKAFLHDILYAMFYRHGYLRMVVAVSLAQALDQHVGFLRTDLLADLPLYASIPTYWIITDFLLYWVHRARHSIPWLWAFHTVHHAATEMSTLTSERKHPLDEFVVQFSFTFTIAFVLGLPIRSWLPLGVAASMLQALQHAKLDWQFGPLYRVLVSPVFHNIHHSDDPNEYDTNYASMFSFWDYLFGTASSSKELPKSYGVRGLHMPESLFPQFFVPVAHHLGRRAAGGRGRRGP